MQTPSGSQKIAEPPAKIQVSFVEGKGRGIVATQPIHQGEIIEVCPLVVLSRKDSAFVGLESDKLKFYTLELVKARCHVLHLGYGMLYNHSEMPNSELEYEATEGNPPQSVLVRALTDISPGEEIVYDYCFEEEEEKFLAVEKIHAG